MELMSIPRCTCVCIICVYTHVYVCVTVCIYVSAWVHVHPCNTASVVPLSHHTALCSAVTVAMGERKGCSSRCKHRGTDHGDTSQHYRDRRTGSPFPWVVHLHCARILVCLRVGLFDCVFVNYYGRQCVLIRTMSSFH